MGATRKYTEEEVVIAKDKIITGLSKGKSLEKIRRQDKTIPSRQVIYRWLNPNDVRYDKEFRNNYAQAREDSADADVDKLEKLVDDVRKKKLQPDQARVMADILKWTAGRKKPKKYGDKIDHTTNGKEITQQVTIFKIPDNGRGKDAAGPEEETPSKKEQENGK